MKVECRGRGVVVMEANSFVAVGAYEQLELLLTAGAHERAGLSVVKNAHEQSKAG